MSKSFFAYIFFLGTITSTLPAYELSIATIFQNEAPYLQEWIEYHRMVGVEHFWLYNDESTDNWEEVLRPYRAEKIVEVINWPSHGFKNYIVNQRNSCKDALKRATGVTKWLALMDVDEFLHPDQERTVTECLAKHFSHAAGVYIHWHHFGTGGITLQDGESLLFQLTTCGNMCHPKNSTGKSIVRPECTQPDDLLSNHHFAMKQGARYYNGDGQELTLLGPDLKLDGKVHSKLIRLNHYTMRDENFFHSVRLARTRGLGLEERLVWEHYHAFNLEQDRTIIDFIREKHPEKYEKFWKSRVVNR